MVNYNNSKIYIIKTDQKPELYYIGATTSNLQQCFNGLKQKYQKYCSGDVKDSKLKPVFDIIAYSDACIVLLEACNFCSTKDEVNSRLYFWKHVHKQNKVENKIEIQLEQQPSVEPELVVEETVEPVVEEKPSAEHQPEPEPECAWIAPCNRFYS
jgi:hypothetical protein